MKNIKVIPRRFSVHEIDLNRLSTLNITANQLRTPSISVVEKIKWGLGQFADDVERLLTDAENVQLVTEK